MDDLSVIRDLPRSHELILDHKEARVGNRIQPLLNEHWRFLASFLRRPATVGALAPSSPFLAEAMLERCNLKTAKTVMELGPGTGAITRMILERIGRNTTFVALELDSKATRDLRKRFPGLDVYADSAEHVQKYLALHGRKKADCIVSGLPWASIPDDVQERILRAILRCLKASGTFTTFAYLHAMWMPNARRFRERLEQYFGTVRISRAVWRNFPPAYVYSCR